MLIFLSEFFSLHLFFIQNNILLYGLIVQNMKNTFLYIAFLFAFISCENNVTFNNPSFQAQKNNIFWRAIGSKAYFSGNSFTIDGFTQNETVSLKTSDVKLGTYILGKDVLNTASYSITDANGAIFYSTGLNIGEGQIEITEFDAVNNTVSGTFKFNAVNNTLPSSILNFKYGNFYKVPIK
jgi:hypothetical protein